jgi:hypothetical protein
MSCVCRPPNPWYSGRSEILIRKIRGDWTSGNLATTHVRIFCLSIGYLKMKGENVQNCNPICSIWVWNFVSHFKGMCWGEYDVSLTSRECVEENMLYLSLQGNVLRRICCVSHFKGMCWGEYDVSLTSRECIEENMLCLSLQGNVLRRICWHEEEVQGTGENCVMRNFIIYTLH